MPLGTCISINASPAKMVVIYQVKVVKGELTPVLWLLMWLLAGVLCTI